MSYNKTIWKSKDIITREKLQKIEDQLEVLSEQDISGGNVTDVQVNGVSVLDGQGVANVPLAAGNIYGVGRVGGEGGTYGIRMVNGQISTNKAESAVIKSGRSEYRPVVPYHQHEATFYGLAKAAGADMNQLEDVTVGVYSEYQMSAIHEMFNAPVIWDPEDSMPSITAMPGIRYVCGEVATLDITLPASGCIDVVFESGSTPTVLTITPPTGVTVKWANGFDPDNLEADTTYEINIKDGLGVAGTWT